MGTSRRTPVEVTTSTCYFYSGYLNLLPFLAGGGVVNYMSWVAFITKIHMLAFISLIPDSRVKFEVLRRWKVGLWYSGWCSAVLQVVTNGATTQKPTVPKSHRFSTRLRLTAVISRICSLVWEVTQKYVQATGYGVRFLDVRPIGGVPAGTWSWSVSSEAGSVCIATSWFFDTRTHLNFFAEHGFMKACRDVEVQLHALAGFPRTCRIGRLDRLV
jgi:hypothetical protein